MKPSKTIGKLLKIGTLLSSTGFIFTVSLQIFARFFLASAPSWTEELSRLFFIYAISFAAGLALKNKAYVQLDILYDKFNDLIKKRLDLFISTFTFAVFVVLSIITLKFIVLGIPENSPSLKIPMSYSFFSILILNGSISYYAFFNMVKSFKAFYK